MRLLTVLILAIGALVAWYFLHERGSSTQAPNVAPSPSAANPFLALRGAAVHASRADLGLPAPPDPATPWGVVMETGMDGGSMTLVAFSDGNASIYLSSGGGFIGGVGQAAVHRAATSFVEASAHYRSQMTPTKDFPLPAAGQTVFYFLTDSGTFSAAAAEQDLGNQRHPLSPLFLKGHEVLTQYRLLNEGK